MNKKYLKYAVMPALTLALIGGAGLASAHGLGFMGEQVTPEQVAQKQSDMFQHQADLLGVDVNVVKEAWAEGKTFGQLAQEQGITQEQLKEKMQQEHEQRLQQHLQSLVDTGVITQEQADKRLDFMKSNFEEGGMKSFRGHHRGMMGM